MKYSFSILAALAVLMLSVPFALAEDGEQIRIKADSITHDQAHDSLQVNGNVEINWDAITLFADKVFLSQPQNEADASGKVRLLRNDDLLTSDRLRINYVTQQGEAENAALFIKQSNFHITGQKIAKTGKDDYRLERGTFTTCDGDNPSWKFTASDLDVTMEEYATGRHAILYLKDLPVFYVPYLLFPVKRERQSGLLFPRIGSSSKKGFYLDVPYYWAISPSQDATFDLDLQTRRGVGSGVDYRYLGKNGSNGTLHGYVIYDTDQDRGRADVVVRQQEYLAPGLAFKADAELATDRGFYRDFGETSGEYNRQMLDSVASLSKDWRTFALSGELRYVNDLDGPSNRGTLQRLPTLTFSAVPRKLGPMPLFASLDSSFVNFSRNEGQAGQRIDLQPRLALYRELGGAGLSVWGNYRQRFYNGYGADEGRGFHSAGLVEAGATMTTALERIYSLESGALRKVRHTLVPELSFAYVQEKGQESLPFYDYDDRVVGGNMLGWALNNYVTGKFLSPDGSSSYWDILYLRLSQGYQLSGSRRDLLTLVDEGRPFSDIRLEASLTPWRQFTFSTDSRYNPYRSRFSTAGANVEVKDDAGNSAGIGYQYARDKVEYLEGTVGLSLVKPFVFQYTGRYSFDRGDFLESFYSLEYRHQCWSLTLSYRDRTDNQEFLVSFSLAGLGSLGKIKAF